MEPLSIVLCAVAALVVGGIWVKDYLAWRSGKPFERALAGATGAPARLILLSAAVSAAIMAVETACEHALGISKLAQPLPVILLVPTVCFALLEEILFRGYLVIQGKSRVALVTSIVIFSLIFAALHGHFLGWTADGKGFQLRLTPATILWSVSNLSFSLWWYAVRFLPSNKERSMLPVFAGRGAALLTLFLIDLATGRILF
jgi:membrane protease YdiL (CAAX protease family)